MKIIQSSKLEAHIEKPRLAYSSRSTFIARKHFCFLLSTYLLFLLSTFLIGCTHLKEYSQSKNRLSAISEGNLKGMSKVDVIKEFGQPVATSKSQVCECWYYAKPKTIWIWFEENKVDHWDVE